MSSMPLIKFRTDEIYFEKHRFDLHFASWNPTLIFFSKISVPFSLYYGKDDVAPPIPYFSCYILPHSHDIPFLSIQLDIFLQPT